MINEISTYADERMGKSIESMHAAFARIRSGRAHPSILDSISVSYYGSEVPLSQAASIRVEDARTLAVSPWEKDLILEIERAIRKSDLGLNPTTSSDVIRVPLAALTEESRRDLTRQARQEAEAARIAIRNIRRDAISDVRELVKEKEATQDDAHRAEENIQSITDRRINEVDQVLAVKQADLMEI